MVTNDELEGFRRDRYLARSWALLTRDKGWIKPVLLMTVALLVPVVGWLGVVGYIVEWARLTAWGVNSAPKQKGVRVGECIKSGWRVLLVAVVWGLVMGVIGAVIDWLPLGVLGFVWDVITILLTVVVCVAEMRATIYQKFGAGMRVSTIWEMVKHDPAGLARVFGMDLLFSGISFAVAFVVMFSALVSLLPEIIYLADMMGSYSGLMSDSMQARLILQLVAAIFSSMGPALLVLALVTGFVFVIGNMLVYTALGLWLRQFNVPAWGRDEDPLPPFVGDPRDGVAWNARPEAPGAGPAGATATPPAGAAAWTAPESVPVAEPVVTPVTEPAAAPASQAAAAQPADTQPAPAHEPIPMPPAAPEVVERAAEVPTAVPGAPEPASFSADEAAAPEVIEVTPVAVAPVEVPSEELTPAPSPAEEPEPASGEGPEEA